ncbi:MAG TPA: hypothetical protein VF097_02375 [Actinomycetota bacterium]
MRRMLVASIVAAFVVGASGIAQADHTHVRILPTGDCVILAADGNEKYVVLPDENPHVDAGLPENRKHPLHVLVHLGQPGSDGSIAVMGSAQDPCSEAGGQTGSYVNP